MGKRYEDLQEAMCRELEMLDKKYASDAGEMTAQDVEKADKLYHALKSAETYHAMKDASEWDEEGTSERMGRSYARRRDSMGRYTSRDMRGYSGGYSGAYPDERSGRYPMYPNGNMSYGYPPEEWRY